MKGSTNAPAAPADSPLADSPALDQLELEAGAAADAGAGAAPPSDATPAVPTAQLCTMVLGPLFAIFAPNWNVTASEVDQLGQVYGAVVDKYFPKGLGKYDKEIAAVVVTCAIVMPRAHKPPKIDKPKEEPPPADASA